MKRYIIPYINISIRVLIITLWFFKVHNLPLDFIGGKKSHDKTTSGMHPMSTYSTSMQDGRNQSESRNSSSQFSEEIENTNLLLAASVSAEDRHSLAS